MAKRSSLINYGFKNNSGRVGFLLALKGVLVTELAIIALVASFIFFSSGSWQPLRHIIDMIGYINLITFAGLTLLFSGLFGKKAGEKLAGKKFPFLATYIGGFFLVACSTLIASVCGLGIDYFTGDIRGNWFFFYIIKPVVWMWACSILPVVIAGTWYAFKLTQPTPTDTPDSYPA